MSLDFSSSKILMNKITISDINSDSFAVPTNHIALVFKGEKYISMYNENELINIQVDFKKINKLNSLCILLMNKENIKDVKWGFGKVSVYNNISNKQMNIGISGSCDFEVVDYYKLAYSYLNQLSVNYEQIEKELKDQIKCRGKMHLEQYFYKKNVSIDELKKASKDFLESLTKCINNIELIKKSGLHVTNILSKGFYFDENEINKETTQNSINELRKEMNDGFSSVKQDIKQNIESQKQNEKKISEFEQYIIELMNNKRIVEYVPTNTNDEFSVYHTIINATKEKHFIAAASVITSAIESNFMDKYHLRHEKKDFVMQIDEFYELLEVFKEYDPSFSYRIKYLDFNKGIVEMPVPFRFYKSINSIEKSIDASYYWHFLSKYRHKSVENRIALENELNKRRQSKSKFLEEMYHYFVDIGVYTEE